MIITEPNGASSTGHSGNGYARITLLGIPYQNVFYSYHNETTLDVMMKDEVCNESINLPSKVDNKPVVSILPRAFYGNSCLRSIKIPKTVESIGSEAFSMASNLREVVFEQESLCNSIGNFAFSDTSLAKISIPSLVTSIGEWCFKSTALNYISFESPSHLESIPAGCFHGSDLASIYIPQSVKTFQRNAFSNSNIQSIDFNTTSQLELIDESCFSNSHIRSITIPDSVKIISNNAFERTFDLDRVTFGSGCLVEIIPQMCFLNSNINSIYISKKISSIGKNAFLNSAIQTVRFDALSICQNISEKSFFNTSLSSISLPPSVAIIGNYAFANCSRLQFVSYCSSTYQENRNIFDKSDMLKNVSVAYYFLFSTSEFANLETKLD
ncbi:hypothetical protein TVAG_042340 [Trichomonas vaginalis G3]|uniref:Surface antigen BspA-like n=1 Tax=Trichomonas vaginalis (strain ATCC PRA-98 / G3) TaxID=412133 RepID=A2EUX3_TRIV3|nr:ribonuclease inhibitor domain-containing protein [Trichomonas vaginalis G3]EAY03582.1 hypothetical protein TVAG_042340 [Trichomonas vaginalis G3]KAI5550088.1 ribonuclease inhibitor domain-containing protein [Trichomonas vaginalis G3]|eukprot:XP_001315805.1 hypothetical protein [Trichomonas vaginalis G3]